MSEMSRVGCGAELLNGPEGAVGWLMEMLGVGTVLVCSNVGLMLLAVGGIGASETVGGDGVI